MTNVLLIGLGGFCGAIARYGAGLLLHRTGAAVPVATLAVNVVGCFAIGVLSELFEERADERTQMARRLVVVGFLGSFTTFSAFGYETDNLLRQRGVGPAAMNVALNVVLGLGAVVAGRALAKRFG